MPSSKNNNFKVKDFLKALLYLEKLSSLGNNHKMVKFINRFRNSLTPFGELNDKDFIDMLENNLQNTDKPVNDINTFLESIDINDISLDELRKLLYNQNFTKEQLLDIAEIRFGISRGTHERLRKREIQELIEKAMQNIETLQIIAKKASK
ncbi:MAG: hypothetical protein APF84_06760 [Gracilibacter sp. BRH_c7a]|nr:MAG: hypothetical protein APF84_06760 [Gracilibacter sp. BRH_c7a]